MQDNVYLSYSAGYMKTFEDFIKFSGDEGFSGVELIPDLQPNLIEQFDEHRTEKLISLKNQYGLEFSVHNVYLDINITSLVPKVRELALEITSNSINFAKRIGAKTFIMHPGYFFPPWRSDPQQKIMYRKIEKEILSILKMMADKVDIPILFENGNYYLSSRYGKRRKLHTGITYDEILNLINLPKINSFGICFDVGKAYLSVENTSVTDVMDYLIKIQKYVKEIHVNTFPDYEKILPPIFSHLRSIGYNAPIVFECAKQNIDSLKKLLN